MANSQRQLAEFLASFSSAAISENARNVARQSLIDTMAVSFAGRSEPVALIASSYVTGSHSKTGAVGWVDGISYQPEAAALLNAVTAHALDYDDVTPAWRGHPGAVIWPALFASVEGLDVSLEDLLNAYVLGFEVGAQIGINLRSLHYPAGWHSTCTIGVIAATAASARARRLDAQKTSHALGLAIAQSSGLQSNFGTMAKPFQAGFAASAAVRATQLATLGADASGNVLEERTGFCSLYGGKDLLTLTLPVEQASVFAIIEQGIEVKHFPSCYATHRAVEAALLLRKKLANKIDQIVSIEIEGSPQSHTPLIIGMPGSIHEARFSVEFGIACALLEGNVRLQSFIPEKLQQASVQRLMARTIVTESVDLGPERTARVSAELTDGTRWVESVSTLPGKYGETAFMQRLENKFLDCMAYGGLQSFSSRLWNELLSAQAESDTTLLNSTTFRSIFAAAKCPSSR